MVFLSFLSSVSSGVFSFSEAARNSESYNVIFSFNAIWKNIFQLILLLV